MTTKREYQERQHIYNALQALGFTYAECESLRRISMTLRRWHELECGTEHGCIERDEHSGIPQWRRSTDTGNLSGRPIADRETGAKKRLARIMQGKPVTSYIQADPRGAALYILRPGDVPAGADAGAYYSRGICVY